MSASPVIVKDVEGGRRLAPCRDVAWRLIGLPDPGNAKIARPKDAVLPDYKCCFWPNDAACGENNGGAHTIRAAQAGKIQERQPISKTDASQGNDGR